MIYAPVIIPTLCRFEHLRRCLKSLSECTWANETNVYISLDYSINDACKEGYHKINDYLNDIGKYGFKNLIFIKQKTNLGAYGNTEFLINLVNEKYDRWIFSEDDNIFSPNFLMFVDKGLELFEKDDSIFAICGYSHPYQIKTSDNNYFMQNVDFSAWGVGIWRDQYLNYKEEVSRNFFSKKMSKISSYYKLYRQGLNRLEGAIHLMRSINIVPFMDNNISVYMPLAGMNVVMPKLSTVRNEGWDGSGINCKTSDVRLRNMHNKQLIDTSEIFKFYGNGYNFYKHNRNVFAKQSYGRITFKVFFKKIKSLAMKKIYK